MDFIVHIYCWYAGYLSSYYTRIHQMYRCSVWSKCALEEKYNNLQALFLYKQSTSDILGTNRLHCKYILRFSISARLYTSNWWTVIGRDPLDVNLYFSPAKYPFIFLKSASGIYVCLCVQCNTWSACTFCNLIMINIFTIQSG